ncbi:MAG: hypothetical protein IJ499_03150, partial [Clostridia bacterium]|nr:hypothetical protein [Clostridia bacterium]
MNSLSEREKQIYNYILNCINSSGYSPSVRDIGAALGIKSTSTVHFYLEKLKQKGYLKKTDNVSRSLRPDTLEKVYRVPIVCNVTAGMPITAIENYDGYYSFSSIADNYEADSLFALRVSGESMIEAGILDGDL